AAAAAPLPPPSPSSFTAISNPGFLGLSGVNSALAVKFVISKTRQVPRMAPIILLSSKESILIRPHAGNVEFGRRGTATDEPQESGFRPHPRPAAISCSPGRG